MKDTLSMFHPFQDMLIYLHDLRHDFYNGDSFNIKQLGQISNFLF